MVDSGVSEIDGRLPDGGLAPGVVKVAGAAATGFAVVPVTGALGRGGHLVWLGEERTLHAAGMPWPPGLVRLGLGFRRLLLVHCPNQPP